MKIKTAANVLNNKWLLADATIKAVSTDTRTLQAGDLFIALQGPNFDGHHFIQAAETAGAIAAVVSEPVKTNLPIIQVADTRKALGDLAAYHRQQINPTTLAMTGSCGKTTTRALLASIMQEQGETLASQSSYNNDIGVPLTLLGLQAQHQFLVAEMGANHLGEIAYLTQLVQPDVAIITNIAPAHLEGFGSLEGVAKAKGEIFQGLGENGTAIINIDNDHYADFWAASIGGRRVLRFGLTPAADVTAENIQFNAKLQPTFELTLPDKKSLCVSLQLMGQHNVMNALAASAAAFAVGVDIEKIKHGLESAHAVTKRLNSAKGLAGIDLIDDSYNANPLSVSAAVKILANCQGESVLVMGDMKELGETADQMHREIGEQAKRCGINRVYSYGEHCRFLAEAFGENAFHYQDQDQLITDLKQSLHADMTVLVKGSLSMNMSRVASALSVPEEKG